MGHDLIDEFGVKRYYLNDQLHREGGPAVEYSNGDKSWYQNGLWHRLDGPALEYANGYKSWWYQGKFIDCHSQEEFERIIKLKIFWE